MPARMTRYGWGTARSRSAVDKIFTLVEQRAVTRSTRFSRALGGARYLGRIIDEWTPERAAEEAFRLLGPIVGGSESTLRRLRNSILEIIREK